MELQIPGGRKLLEISGFDAITGYLPLILQGAGFLVNFGYLQGLRYLVRVLRKMALHKIPNYIIVKLEYLSNR